MKVTPVKKKFGRYQVGQVFELPDRSAKALIKAGKLEAASIATIAVPAYQTRMLQAEEPSRSYVAEIVEAPYGYKADGTPRKRPGRSKAAE